LSFIVGTWNFVNETGTSGAITFKGDRPISLSNQDPTYSPFFIQTIGGKIINGTWSSDGYTLTLAYNGGHGGVLTFTGFATMTVNPNHLEPTDQHGDTIRLMR
jgi:hypothetical protein